MSLDNSVKEVGDPSSLGLGSLPSQAKLFYQSYPNPLWVQVDTLALGDVLVLKTQASVYYVTIVGARGGLIFSDKLNFSPQEIVIYGGYDLQEQQPSWGKLQVGVPFLYAPIDTPTEAVKTSPLEAIYFKKAALRPLGAFGASGASSPTTSAASPLRSLGPVVKAGVAPLPVSKLSALAGSNKPSALSHPSVHSASGTGASKPKPALYPKKLS